MSNVRNAIEYALDNKLSDMTASLEAAIKEKVLGAIEAKKVEVAQTMFNPVAESVESDDEDSEDDIGPEDFELDEEELNELSTDTLKSYIGKAKKQVKYNKKLYSMTNRNLEVSGEKVRHGKTNAEIYPERKAMDDKRKKGIGQASVKISEEDIEGLDEHTMHTHTVHFSNPESGEWVGKMLINADSDKSAVNDAHGMAKKHGLKVMRVSKNNSVMVDKTIGENIEIDEMCSSCDKDGEKNKPSFSHVIVNVPAHPDLHGKKLKVISGSESGPLLVKHPEWPETLPLTLHPHQYSIAESIEIDETLDPSMGAEKYIHDFVHSKNPKFAGKSKKERIQMALGSYYAAKKAK